MIGFNNSYAGDQWVKACDGNIPKGAVISGKEANGENLYIARARYRGGLHPGKVRPEFGAANIPWGGKEEKVKCYEVFVGNGKWVQASGGNIPVGAIKAGKEADGKPLYIARAYYEGGLHPGKVRPEFGAANIPWGHKEVKVYNYEVLVQADSPPSSVPVWKASCKMWITYSNGSASIGSHRYEGRGITKEAAKIRAKDVCEESGGQGEIRIFSCTPKDCRYLKE